MTAQIVSAHCANNTVAAEALPGLIQQIHQTLAAVNEPVVLAEKPVPAMSPRRSLFPDYIVCLENGKKLTMLKPTYNMSPANYWARWDLPRDDPMVAPNYTERRSVLARQIGVGRKGRNNGSRGSNRQDGHGHSQRHT